MSRAQHPVIAALLERHPRSIGQQIGADLAKNTPAPLFRWLCFSLLASARIGHRIAYEATRALFQAGWTSPRAMAAATWEERVGVLNRSGYARYDESTSRMLGQTCEMLLDLYKGDLRKLREAAGRDPGEERRLLKQFKGIGDVGADIFFREAQAAWDELYPFADRVALRAADRLGLGRDGAALARQVDRGDFHRLVSALVTVELDGAYDELEARGAPG